MSYMNENKQRMKEPIEKYIKKAEEWSKIILSEKGAVSDKDQKVFESIKSGEYARWRKSNINRFDKQAVKKRVDAIRKSSSSKVIRIPQWWNSVAAVFVIGMLAAGGYWLYTDMQKIEDQMIMPGSSIAYLEIDNKKKIELVSKDSLLLFQAASAQLDSGKIVYDVSDTQKEEVEYHKINVPRNGEFFVQLSDGTKVWVNSDSKLGFNSKFVDDKRIVDLQGEAYFEVAKNPNKPFIVRTTNANIKVLGTMFNVKAYKDDMYTYATLNEGKVQVGKGEINEILQPNEQLAINNRTAEYSKRNVDASIYSAWAQGKLRFKDERLEDIMNDLGRWYDVSIFYPYEELKDMRFSISINRYDNIELLLNQMELTNKIRFELNEKAVVVHQNE